MFSARGFALSKNLNINKSEYILKSRDELTNFCFEQGNFFAQVTPTDEKFLEKIDFIKKKYNIKNILICGRFYDDDKDFLLNFETAIKHMVLKDDMSYFRNVDGRYSLVVETEDKLKVFNGRSSLADIFWNFDGNTFKASNYHFPISTEFDRQGLIQMLYLRPALVFKNLHILLRNSLVTLNYKTKKCYYQINVIPPKKILSGKESMDDIGELVYNTLLNATKKSIQGHKSIALALSGGIDSGAVARCLADLGANATFYTWSSLNKKSSEFQNSKQVADMLGYEVVEVVMDDDNYKLTLSEPSSIFPYDHPVSDWMEAFYPEMLKRNTDLYMTGIYGSIFESNIGFFNDVLPIKLSSAANTFFREKLGKTLVNISPAKSVIPYKGYEIFTEDAQRIIRSSLLFKDIIPTHSTNIYSHSINFFEKYNIALDNIYRDGNIFDITYSLPKCLRQQFHGGASFNKLALRYAMKDKLPKDVVIHCGAGNLNYAALKRVPDHTNEIKELFNENSYLVKNDIIDLKKLNAVLEDHEKAVRNATTLKVAYTVEKWFDTYYQK